MYGNMDAFTEFKTLLTIPDNFKPLHSFTNICPSSVVAKPVSVNVETDGSLNIYNHNNARDGWIFRLTTSYISAS